MRSLFFQQTCIITSWGHFQIFFNMINEPKHKFHSRNYFINQYSAMIINPQSAISINPQSAIIKEYRNTLWKTDSARNKWIVKIRLVAPWTLSSCLYTASEITTGIQQETQYKYKKDESSGNSWTASMATADKKSGQFWLMYGKWLCWNSWILWKGSL